MVDNPYGASGELAPAKVNLFLHVVGRRGDGYHLLESLFVFANIADRLYAEEAPELGLKIIGPQAHQILDSAENLVLKAAEALRQARPAAKSKGARLILEKNLPVAAGLGGGSADAAAALRLLSRLWQVDISGAELQDLALKLGADVPACLDGKPKLVSGIGEILVPLPSLPTLYLVLVNPGISVSTAQVFAERARRGDKYSAAGMPGIEGLDASGIIETLAARGNDLEAAAISLEPEIGIVIASLARQSGCRISRMSGSGATCFGLFLQKSEAVKAAAKIREEHSSWWIWSGSLAQSDFLEE